MEYNFLGPDSYCSANFLQGEDLSSIRIKSDSFDLLGRFFDAATGELRVRKFHPRASESLRVGLRVSGSSQN